MELLIGLDIGTTALKVACFDKKGTLLAVSTQEYDLITPQTNYVEEEPEVYWKAFLDGINDLKSQYPIRRLIRSHWQCPHREKRSYSWTKPVNP